MNNFKVIYRILKYLEEHMDDERIDAEEISHTKMGISFNRWEQLLWLMQSERYITGLRYTQTLSDAAPHVVTPISPRITLKGLEYLEENSMMKKAAEVLKNIKDITPGL